MIHPNILIGVLDLIYKDQTCEDWSDALAKVGEKVRKDEALSSLSVALPKFARQKDFVLFKEPERWQKEVEKVYGQIPELDIGVRMSGVIIDFKRTKNRACFLRLPLEERWLAESLFE